jgi:hypothetical protein
MVAATVALILSRGVGVLCGRLFRVVPGAVVGQAGTVALRVERDASGKSRVAT